MLTIYTNQPGKNRVQKQEKKTIKFEVVGERPATMNIQISWTAHEAPLTEWREPFDSHSEFPDFPSK